jgi:RNA-directed DNA polymerase
MRITPLPRRRPHARRDRSEPAATNPVKKSIDAVWAQALAYAYLDGDWTDEALIRRSALVLGHDRPAMKRLARRALRAYPRPPLDRPRELASWLAANDAFRPAITGSQLNRWLPFQPAMGHMPWPVPAIPTVGELAHFFSLSVSELAWLADVRSTERRVIDERLRNYRYRWVRKAAGGMRLIESPKQRLREMQRHLLATILNRVPAHRAAHGFVRGRSTITFAREHSGADVVIRLDLNDFFGSITAGRIYGVFRTAGYPESVAHTLTGLTTNVVPLTVWSEAPPPVQTSGPLHEHFLFGKRLATPHLPQGAPTSPALANLCAHGLDRRLAGLAESAGLRYSRYADDLAFSGSPSREAVPRLIELIQSISTEEGFRINEPKTVVMGKGHRQRVAGIVVNRKPNLDRPAYDVLRATLHNVAVNGLEAENRRGHSSFADHLAGRVSWAASLNVDRRRVLRRLLTNATASR